MKIRMATVALLSSAALLTACSGSVSVGATVLDKDDIASNVEQQLTEQVGQAPDDVTCPEDVDAKVGATTTCTLTAGDGQLPVTVTVTAYEGGKATYDIEVQSPAAG